MSDAVFQWSFTGTTVLAVAWMVLGILLGVTAAAWVVITAIVFWVVVGAWLLRFWGRRYRVES